MSKFYFPHHLFQRRVCEYGLTPVLNLGCAEDPADLAPDFGAKNMDMVKYQNPQNWVQGDARDTKEPADHYGTIILGEVLEHCEEKAAQEILCEMARILHPNGIIGITTPFDTRSFEQQCTPGHMFTNGAPHEVAPGCWEHHISIWTRDKIEPLLEVAGLAIVNETLVQYGVEGCTRGAGRILQRVNV